MNESFIENIEAYLEGSISRETLQQIADKEGIVNLEEEIRWFRDSQVAIEAAGLRQQIKEILPQASKKEAKVVRLRRLRTVLAIAASVLVIVVAYLGWNNAQSDSLYAEYEYIAPGPPMLMSQSDDYELYDALTYYGEGNYGEAARRLQGIVDAYPNSDTLAFYLGASLLYQGETAAARSSLENLLRQEDSRFQQRAEWLLVLLALKEKDWATAEARLSLIRSTPDHEFYDSAQSLAETLREEIN